MEPEPRAEQEAGLRPAQELRATIQEVQAHSGRLAPAKRRGSPAPEGWAQAAKARRTNWPARLPAWLNQVAGATATGLAHRDATAGLQANAAFVEQKQKTSWRRTALQAAARQAWQAGAAFPQRGETTAAATAVRVTTVRAKAGLAESADAAWTTLQTHNLARNP